MPTRRDRTTPQPEDARLPAPRRVKAEPLPPIAPVTEPPAAGQTATVEKPGLVPARRR